MKEVRNETLSIEEISFHGRHYPGGDCSLDAAVRSGGLCYGRSDWDWCARLDQYRYITQKIECAFWPTGIGGLIANFIFTPVLGCRVV